MQIQILSLVALFAGVQGIRAEIGTELVATGFERPVYIGAPKGMSGKLWVVEQGGKIWVVDLKTGEREKEPFLDISDKVTRKSNEQGLLGLAFAPDFAESGTFYVNYTDKEGDTKVVRYVPGDFKKNDKGESRGKGELVIGYDQPFGNHNAGWLDFGPDGMLYISTGDGGSGFDPKGNGQNVNTLLGKLLRIDVSGTGSYKIPPGNGFADVKGARPEIHAIGLRNPWRSSFDRETGDFWIGDVGQNAWEEIDFVKAGELGGQNFGWRLREGDIETPDKDKRKIGGDKPENYHPPIYVYKHGSGPTEGLSVTGGFLYRGGDVPEMKGRYIFGDYQNPRIWSFKEENGKMSDFKDHTSGLQPEKGRINLVSSFGEDGDGELYIADLSGPVYKIVRK